MRLIVALLIMIVLANTASANAASHYYEGFDTDPYATEDPRWFCDGEGVCVWSGESSVEMFGETCNTSNIWDATSLTGYTVSADFALPPVACLSG
ncbi:MAG TPA: hypothetical protein VJB99_03675 [Patescibacteria group bacterium]|nr:hypothetical protein [Patescibacteria group bacterium]